MKLDHCHRASCVQVIEQLRTIITKQQARIAELEQGLDKFIGEHEECLDQDEWLALMCSAEAFHEAQGLLENEDGN